MLRFQSDMARYHVHAINWNESRLLPVFFRHYASASKIFIHDNESDPSIQKSIREAGAELIPFSTGQTLDDAVHQRIKNSVWKESRGSADYVIVQDLDEFVHFPWMPGDIPSALDIYKGLGVTYAKSKCYCIVCSDAEWDAVLSSTGEPWTRFCRGAVGDILTGVDYDKVQVFSPDHVRESCYTTGAHSWGANGSLISPPSDLEPLMLHCKHIGKKYEVGRRLSIKSRMSQTNKEAGFGWQYQQDEAVITTTTERVYTDSRVKDISSVVDKHAMTLFSNDWTGHLSKTLSKFFPDIEKSPAQILEIGCFEGRGTLILLDHFCRHKDSVIHCVDPWEDRYVRNRQEFKECDHFFIGQYERFIFNTRQWRAKIRTFRDISNNVIPALTGEYDLVYIDGDHHPEQVYQDALMAFRVTKRGGTIIFDDYQWSLNGLGPKEGADRFVKEFGRCLEVIHSGDQLVVRVMPKWSDPYIVRTTQVLELPSVVLDTFGASDAISGPLFGGAAWEPPVALFIASFFKGRKNAGFLDLGANIGIHTIGAIKSGARHAFSFECHPVCAAKLRGNVRLNLCSDSVTIVPLAVSDATGKSVILRHVGNNVGASFIDSPTNRFLQHSTSTYQCETIRLDNFNFSPPLESFDTILAKIDVEGHELEALTGMGGILASGKIESLLLELNPFTSANQKLMDLLHFLTKNGWTRADVVFSVPSDTWHGSPLHLSTTRTPKAISLSDLGSLLKRDVILEVALSR